MNMHNNNVGRNFAILMTGVAVGTAASLLFAPQSGRETRKMIRRKSEDAAEYCRDQGHQFAKTSRKVYGEAKGLVDGATEAFARGRRAVLGA